MYTADLSHSEYVDLTNDEYVEAYQRGLATCRSSQERGLREKAVSENRHHIQAVGEVAVRAVAKHLGIEWLDNTDSFKAADLPHNIEVRLLGREWYGLRVRDDDDDSRRVVGVVIEPGKERHPYRIPGWIFAKQAKQPEWIIDPRGLGRPMYAVPQEFLQGLDSLRELIC